jgi:uncharacterized protein
MLTRREWQLEAVVSLLLWVCLSFAVGGLLAGVLPKSLGIDGTSRGKLVTILCGQAVFHGCFAVGLVRFLRQHGRAWREMFGVDAGHGWRAVGIGIGANGVLLPAAYGLQWLMTHWLRRLGVDLPSQRSVELLLEDSSLLTRGFLFALAACAAPVVEEILFRGILFAAVRDAGFPKVAWIGTSLLFGLIHGNQAAFVPLSFVGLTLAGLYWWTGNLLAPVAAHATFNLAPFVMLALNVDFGQGSVVPK